MRWLVLVAGCGRLGFEPLPAVCTGQTAGHCYTLVETQVDWPTARQACAVGAAHLATITDADDNATAELFAAMLPYNPADTTNHRSIMWTGGDSIATAGVWVWDDGEPWAYTNWRAGEPSTPATERCLVVLGQESGLWDNRPCADTYGYLCERD